MPKKISDFLNASGIHISRRHKKYKKYLKISGIVLGSFIVLIGILFLIFQKPAKTVYQTSLSGKDHFLKAQDQLLAQDFTSAGQSLDQAIGDFSTARSQFARFRWLKAIPWLGTQIKAVDNLLAAGITTGGALQKVNQLAIDIIVPLKQNDDVSLSTLTNEQTHQLLKQLYESKPTLEEAKLSIDAAVASVNQIPEKGLIKKIKEVAAPLKERVPQLREGIDQGISASQVIPTIAGYPQQKTYLFLLQNNSEMRPTGGFIGTYGILKVKDGDITYFKTDNVYNLDKPAEAWLNVEPPFPLTRYNAVYKWFFRDSNWSPDFPTTAQKAEWFYQQERGPEKNIDGIIAVTPTFIQSLLTLTGEIKVNGLTFTSENLLETLQYQVDQGYLRQGLQESERKEIIGTLSKNILDDVLALPTSKWPDLWKVFTKDISEKQLLLNVQDRYVQDYIIKENWGGAITPVNHDYLAVIDANLASLKSDPGVQRTIDYMVNRDGDNFIADVTVHYNNTGTITWKTTRYRSYVRIYVPLGASLLKSEGAMVDCKINQEGSIDTSEELNKTVFGTFICVEPGEEKTLHLKYKLPQTITDLWKNNATYQLLVQKQGGTADYPLTLNLFLRKKPEIIKGIDNPQINPDNAILLSTVLSQDRLVEITH